MRAEFFEPDLSSVYQPHSDDATVVVWQLGLPVHCNRCDRVFSSTKLLSTEHFPARTSALRLRQFMPCPFCQMTDCHWVYRGDLLLKQYDALGVGQGVGCLWLNWMLRKPERFLVAQLTQGNRREITTALEELRSVWTTDRERWAAAWRSVLPDDCEIIMAKGVMT